MRMGLNSEIPLKLEPQEEVMGEYDTKDSPRQGPTEGNDGKLIVTSRRVLFFHRHASVRKVIKRGAPQLELVSSIPLTQVQRISTGGIVDKYFTINGRRYYLDGGDMRSFQKTIKARVKSLGTPGPEAAEDELEEADPVSSPK